MALAAAEAGGVGGSGLLCCGSDAAAEKGGLVLMACCAAAAPEAGLSGTPWQDGGAAESLRVFGVGGSEGSGAPPLHGFWSLVLLSSDGPSLTGPRTLFAAVASCDTTLSIPLSVGGAGGAL